MAIVMRRKQPIRYTAKVLTDGHLPLPRGLRAHKGEELDVTVIPADRGGNGTAENRKKSAYLMKHWMGASRGCGTNVAEKHDDYLYGRS